MYYSITSHHLTSIQWINHQVQLLQPVLLFITNWPYNLHVHCTCIQVFGLTVLTGYSYWLISMNVYESQSLHRDKYAQII